MGTGHLAGDGGPRPHVSVRTRFDRFPATVKGAFVIRGEDRNPHQVRVRGARAAGLAGGASREVPIDAITVDVPPHENLFVPFELSTIDLDPGWYRLELDADVDGSPGTFEGDRRFPVAWPRGTARSGGISVERHVEMGEHRVTVERIQCALDSSTIRLTVRPPVELSVRLEVDGAELQVLEVSLDESSGRGSVVAYPLMRAHGRLRISLAAGSGAAPAEMEVELPA